ncbi:hypothetical protein [Actinomadura formosensis]|uniref:hypothetical protein n=1 Tax=Actinomadura formosensis TaxID=60706 RepID=UPI00083082E8|nr:hypothetical protein [Actinomadura formosensis]
MARRSGSSPDRFAAAGRSRRKDAETGQAPTPGATARRTKPVRITVDLDPADYRAMRQLVDELAERTDTPTLPHSVMWRALLRQAAADPARREELAAQIRADLTG